MCTLGNESDIHGKKRLKAYFKASLLGLRDTYGSESNGLAGTRVAAFEISWDSAKVSSWPVSGFQAQSQYFAYSGTRAY